MKALKLTAPHKLEILEEKMPDPPGEGEVLIKMKSVGVCGSDVHYYTAGRIGSQVVEYPFAVGHEGAGEIAAVGRGVSDLRPGDRIAIDPAMSCFQCDQCLAGRPHTCRKLRFLGCPGQAEGCLCDYIVMPRASCFRIPDTMSFEEAALSEPLSIGVYAVRRSVPLKGMKIGIFGAGPIGLSVLFAAKNDGVGTVYMTDKLDYRLDLARRAGADHLCNPVREDAVKAISEAEPLLLDVIFECCGDQEALDQAVKLIKPGGKIMIIGIPPTLEKFSFAVDSMRRKEICVQNVRRQNHCVQAALDLIDRRAFDVNVMVTHRFGLKDAPEAFDLVEHYADGVVKAMIHFD